MKYTVRRKTQYWYQIKEGRRIVADCTRGGKYKWTVLSKSGSVKIIGHALDSLQDAVDAFIAYGKKEGDV
ncbi:hypothetical protein Q4E93_13165 [Flavitalea sp. BT771]|uniref:hypothetical protein n=1 Tax=Flavitalea sp. BT771 TaxID=3063329 RepID=UPI0026E25343|nr:hypothetical protein [Flavitalea sp. BT771]MDO6431548.1 hypothetical protein [Flavitalea sp. BT771]MDV6220456.1 hypothetical protein [Flavitalea sp. BT771]